MKTKVKTGPVDHTFYFPGGMPRSGSTLLCNILAQNPRFHTTHTSGCMDVMFGVRNNWNKLIEHQAHPDDAALQRVLKGILHSYYEDIEKPVIVDKCRGWVSLIEMAELALQTKIKIIVPVRDLREILSSFEKLWRKNAKKGQTAGEAENYFQFQTVAGRCDYWSQGSQPVGLAYNRIKDAIDRGFKDRMHFVHFENLTTNPKDTLNGIYKFLGEQPYVHDFDNVEQVTWEDDKIFGFEGLHDIRPKVGPVRVSHTDILGDAASKYANASFWNS